MAAFIALFAVMSRRRQRHNEKTSTEKLQAAVAKQPQPPAVAAPGDQPRHLHRQPLLPQGLPRGRHPRHRRRPAGADRPGATASATAAAPPSARSTPSSLVFGTSERGVDLPEVDEFFESSRPGVHIVGELGGMGLIKNAITQGVQVAPAPGDAVTAQAERRASVDVAIVGAGPAGLATALGLQRRRAHLPHARAGRRSAARSPTTRATRW